MVADRLMQKNNEFTDYENYYQELEEYLPTGLAEAEKSADAFGLAFAEKHRHDSIHYFIGAVEPMGSGLFLCNVLLGRAKLASLKINSCSRVLTWNARNCR